ncbi:MAG: DNRLRE domain-containing protein [Verrucomicrobiales bacterium]
MPRPTPPTPGAAGRIRHFRSSLSIFASAIGAIGLWTQLDAATLALTPIADAAIYEESSGATANGAGEFLLAGRTNQASQSRRRSLLQFDLGALPPDAIITAVSLQLFLFQVNTAATDISFHRVISPWTAGPADPASNESAGLAATVGDVTWRFAQFDQSLWTTPGGDAALEPSATVSIGSTPGFHTWTSPDLVADVAAWLAEPTANVGWILRDSESTPQTAKRFASADHPDPLLNPRLTIEFTSIPEPTAAILLSLSCFVLLSRRGRH